MNGVEERQKEHAWTDINKATFMPGLISIRLHSRRWRF
jgi:hypothetical protein